jgi:hypothetical protein
MGDKCPGGCSGTKANLAPKQLRRALVERAALLSDLPGG